ncbi:xylulose kinase-like [Ostrinia furnacalis]|uniref:xylulose kinase-like n=1 Tax=Ostrinia furnacalis TaxID=93504 RepID=UPI001039F835|nr:xylulose kinase-like [Ostrinia furnacalis]
MCARAARVGSAGAARVNFTRLPARKHFQKFLLSDSSSRLVATGGASVNKELLQIFADVFNTPVYVQDHHANAALLGAAIRAADVWSTRTGTKLPGSELSVSPAATPYADHDAIYTPLLARYRQILAEIPKLGD